MKALNTLFLTFILAVFAQAKQKYSAANNGFIQKAYRWVLLSEPDVVQFSNELIFSPGLTNRVG